MNTIIKTSICLIICLLSIQTVIGQNSGIRKIEKDESEELNRPNDKIRLGYTFSALINSFVGLQMNGAYNLTNDVQINMEAGWIFASSESIISDVSGYRVRPAIRWYFTEEVDHRLHISLGYNIRKTKVQKIGTFTSTNGTIFSNFQYEQKRSLRGLALLFGIDFRLRNRFLIDLGVGIGLGNMVITDNDTPPNSVKNTFLFSNDSPGDAEYPIAILNIKFQYAF